MPRPDAGETAVPPPSPASAATFVLRGVTIAGNRVISTDELEPLWRSLINTAVSVATLEELASRLSAAYRARGFILSQVVLPAQTVSNGVVRFDAIEGFIDRVEVQGGSSAAQRAARMLMGPVTIDRPLQIVTLERAVLLARDILGGQVNTALAPSTERFGAADITTLIEPRPITGFVAVDNRAGRLLGPWTLRSGASIYGQVGRNERIDVQVAATPDARQLRFGQASLAMPLLGSAWPWDGTLIEATADATRANPILSRAGISDFTSVTNENQFRAALVMPLIRTRPENMYARLGFTWRDTTSESVFAGTDLGEVTDNIRVLSLRLSWDFLDNQDGLNLFDVGFRRGIDAFGAAVGAAGPGAPDPEFSTLSGTISRLQRLGDTWSLFVEAVAQWASEPLPTSERFSLGGATLGRGYAPGNTTGDSGLGGRVELRRNLDVLLPSQAGLEAYSFGDWGAAIDRSIDRDGRRWEQLASFGIGLRIDLGPRLSINPEVAFQVAGRPADTVSGKRGARMLVGAVFRW